MDGLGQHLEYQAKLAGAQSGNASHGNEMGRNNDDLPDIGTMVPIERVRPEDMK